MTPKQRKLFRDVVRDGLRIQPQFSAEPTYANGKPYLKSEGVETLEKIKSSMKKRDKGRTEAG